MKKLIGIYGAITLTVWFLAFFMFIKGNILSKILYGLEFYGNFTNILVATSVMMMLYILGASLVSCCCADEYSNKTVTEYLDFLKVPKISWTFLFLVMVTLPLPSKNTVYLLLGSEISEEVANTDIGKDIIGHVKEIIRDTVGEDGEP